MAIIFELVVNFGANNEAAGDATELVRSVGHIDVRGVPVSFAEPFIRKPIIGLPYIEFAVHLRGLGYSSLDPKPDLGPRPLSGDEITGIGHALYDLLRGFSGYRAAAVGWDPEFLVDLDDLEADLRNGDRPDYNGLVLADDLCDRWRLGPEWSVFAPGYRWLPYLGSRNQALGHHRLADRDVGRGDEFGEHR